MHQNPIFRNAVTSLFILAFLIPAYSQQTEKKEPEKEKITSLLSLLEIVPSEESIDYVQNKTQFQLHTLLTEQRHPETWNLSEVVREDCTAGLEMLFKVDQDIVDKLLSEESQLKADIGLLYADPPSEVSENEEVVQLARKAVKTVRGRDPGVSGFGAHCDMGALVNAGIPTVILGPGDLSLAHRADESLSVEELVEAAKVYTALAVLACS